VNIVAVNHPYLIKLARDPAYNWMTSLEPLRSLKRFKRAPPKCCGQPGTAPAPVQVFQSVSGNVNFVSELHTLKAMLRADGLIVNIVGLRAQY